MSAPCRASSTCESSRTSPPLPSKSTCLPSERATSRAVRSRAVSRLPAAIRRNRSAVSRSWRSSRSISSIVAPRLRSMPANLRRSSSAIAARRLESPAKGRLGSAVADGASCASSRSLNRRACPISRATPRSEPRSVRISATPSSTPSISARSVRMVRADSLISGLPGAGDSAAAAGVSEAMRLPIASRCPRIVSISSRAMRSLASRNGASVSSIACARSAISVCLTTRAAPLRVWARRSNCWTTTALPGPFSRSSTPLANRSTRSRASGRKYL
jgi:hypothetical protein